MRVAELSRQAGVSVPTIRYYVREGLLFPGEMTQPNQARYDEVHVRRLKLIRALVEVGGLSLGAVRDVLGAVDEPGSPADRVRVVLSSVAAPLRGGADELRTRMRAEVQRLIERRGWRLDPDCPAAAELAEVLSSVVDLGHQGLLSLLETYADVAESVARAEVEQVGAGSEPEGVVVTTVFGDAALSAIRRLAHEDLWRDK